MYVSPKEARDYYRVTLATLRVWADAGKIDYKKTAGNHYRYWIEITNDGEKTRGGSGLWRYKPEPKQKRKEVIYARVSSSKQREDLERQIMFLTEKHPGATVFSEVGSALNFSRKKLQSLLQSISLGRISLVAIAHKDRVTRFGFEWFEHICKENDVQLLVHNDKNSFKSPKDELVEDLLSVTHSFSSKIYSNRKYANQKDKDCEEGDMLNNKTEGVDDWNGQDVQCYVE